MAKQRRLFAHYDMGNFSSLAALSVYDSDMASYRVVLRRSEEGYSVSCPGLPGCWSQGKTEEDALLNIQMAIREYIEAAEDLANSSDGKIVEVSLT